VEEEKGKLWVKGRPGRSREKRKVKRREWERNNLASTIGEREKQERREKETEVEGEEEKKARRRKEKKRRKIKIN
jgi:hypothetical protein